MEQFKEIWAIIWPVLEMVWKQIDPETKQIWLTKAAKLLAILLVPGLLMALRNRRKRVIKRGPIGTLFYMLLVATYINALWLIPAMSFYYDFRDNYPILHETAGFVLNKTGVKDWIMSLLFAIFIVIVYVALLYLVIEIVSSVLVWVLRADFFKPFVYALGGLGKFAVVISIPFLLSLSTSSVSAGLSTGSAKAPPPGYNQEAWGYIEAGVSNAARNGVYCDIYTLAGIKEYETGQYICTEADETEIVGPCVSPAGAIGMFQFLPETFQRNANRHGVTGSPWNPVVAAEVACYTIAEEVNLSLSQSRDEFIRNFSDPDAGFVWNMDEVGGGIVFDNSTHLRISAMESAITAGSFPPSLQGQNQGDILLWPAPAGSRVTFGWGIPMWYGSDHNGMDVVLQDQAENFLPFPVYAVANGRAYYRVADDCNAGIITLETGDGETFLYVHMSYEESLIKIPVDGTWVSVTVGQELGWVHNGTTTCSDGTHLHFMREDGSFISTSEFTIP